MVNIEVIRVLQASDFASVPTTESDVMLAVDRDTDIVNGTLLMPTSPIDKQFFGVSARINITNLTLDAGGRTISGAVSTLNAGDCVGWFFNTAANKWFRHINPSASVIGAPVYSRVSGSNATTTGQALTDVTGLSNPLVANGVYEFKARLSVSTSAVTTGTQYAMNFSAAGAAIEAGVFGTLTSTAAKGERMNALNTATTTYLTTSAQSGNIVIEGIVIVGANAGNLVVRHLKVTSGTSTVFIHSYLETIRIQ